MKIAIIGAGWAGMAAAVEATQAGHRVVIFEATQTLGGRARAVDSVLPDGTPVILDNGQHILIGAYSETLRLLKLVGVPTDSALLRQPMALAFADGSGVRFPAWPTPFDAVAGIVGARGWQWSDKWPLLWLAIGWYMSGFQCDGASTVTRLCQDLSPRVTTELIQPLCVSALNTEASQASAQVFLRVLKDALFGVQGGSNLLLPKLNLSELFPNAAARWLSQRGAQLNLGARVDTVAPRACGWQVEGEDFDAIIFATPTPTSVGILEKAASAASASVANQIRLWQGVARALRFQAISTVYAWGPDAVLPHPMLALRSQATGSTPAPAQFVFDRGQLGGPNGLLAFVVSASSGERQALQAQVLTQARQQLDLTLQPVQTIVEKRATFACTPGLQRPFQHIAAGLWVCGDYVSGPYPATLEGAVRSARVVVKAIGSDAYDAAHS
jgi:squalene-associated FAD-dependent desaturase